MYDGGCSNRGNNWGGGHDRHGQFQPLALPSSFHPRGSGGNLPGGHTVSSRIEEDNDDDTPGEYRTGLFINLTAITRNLMRAAAGKLLIELNPDTAENIAVFTLILAFMVPVILTAISMWYYGPSVVILMLICAEMGYRFRKHERTRRI
jgi:hypothetical protein